MVSKPVLTLALLPLANLPGACAFSLMPDKPRVALAAIGGALKLDGSARMASTPGTQNNAVDLKSGLNVADREFAVGGRLSWGDGFHGPEFSYLRWEEKKFDTVGLLEAPFGMLHQGDMTTSEVLFQQYQLNYIAKLFEPAIDPLTFRIGGGLGIHHNKFRLEAKSQGNPPDRIQNVKFQDNGLPILRARLEAELRPFTLRFDGGFTDGDFGDIDGTLLDLHVSLRYRIQRGISAWAGFWRYDLPAKGTRDFLPFEFDMDLSGYTLGVRFEF